MSPVCKYFLLAGVVCVGEAHSGCRQGKGEVFLILPFMLGT